MPRTPLDIPKNSRTTSKLLSSVPSVASVRNSNKITEVEPPDFLPRNSKINETVSSSGRGVLPDAPPAGSLELRSGCKARKSWLT